MCTVIFLPDPVQPVLLSNRDEDPKRPRATTPQLIQHKGVGLLCPLDPMGGGSWVGVNEYGNTAVLLNGAFERHKRNPDGYRKSRGTIVLDILSTTDPHSLWTLYVLDNIEPFTLVLYTGNALLELIWDGQSKFLKQFPNNNPAIWSSTTLYGLEARERKASLFYGLYAQSIRSPHALLEQFRRVNDPEDGFFIDRMDAVRTLSTTIVTRHANVAEMEYQDHNTTQVYHASIAIQSHLNNLSV